MDLAQKLEIEKKPFMRDGKPVIYPIVGDVFVFSDKSGVVYLDNLNGQKDEVKKAIKEGQLEGIISSRQGFYIVPGLSISPQGDVEVSATHCCAQPSLYRVLNERIDLAPVIWGNEQ